ncbi:MAG: metal-dependent transcriptional regulator [Lachnospiraceae bacterium]|nr:metal-dependent transcriptional regulator [Lachnospiraceae bacterium]
MGIINESTEDYLETILLLNKKLPVVRAVDIVEELGYSKSSISNALKNLKEKGYITVEIHGYIYLTSTGLALAESIYERHEWFSKWLISLGVDEDLARKDACQLEHALSDVSFEAIKKSIVL